MEGIRISEQLLALRSLLDAWGWGAAVAYIVVFALLGAIGVPPALLMVPAVSGWDLGTALMISATGGIGASLLGFLLSRYLARDWAEPRIPDRLRRYEKRLERHALSTVIVLRLLFFLFPPVTWLLGLSHISLGTFTLGTVIGAMPGMLVYVFTGYGLIQWLLHQPPGRLLFMAFALAAGVGVWAWVVFAAPEQQNSDSED